MADRSIFDAAKEGDVDAVRACLASGADPAAIDEYGFTALQCAAMGTNGGNIKMITEVINALVAAGSPLEYTGKCGRTALYLAAEFSPKVQPVQALIDAGCNPDVSDSHGNHITVNAMTPAVKKLLSSLTGKKPEKKPAIKKTEPLTPAEWNRIKRELKPVFAALDAAGLVTLMNAGTTQEDGFDDCVQIYHERKATEPEIKGFCFYSRQDSARARESGMLPLSFWGAPEGTDRDMKRAGDVIVKTFGESGFRVKWNGRGDTRPLVDVRKKKKKK